MVLVLSYHMKANIHPQYFETQVICACGNRFTVGSTMETVHIELCNKCHPFYTGEQRFVDAASKIQRFKQKQEAAKTFISKKAEKVQAQKQRDDQPKTLREMLLALK